MIVEWIPITESLPDDNVDVLVFNTQGINAASRWKGEWRGCTWNSCGCCYDFDTEVTHWMPLPAAPQADVERETG